MKNNGIDPIKWVHETSKYYRYRLIEPNYNKYEYRIKWNKKDKVDYII